MIRCLQAGGVFLAVAALAFGAAACGGPERTNTHPQSIVVAAAVSLTGAFSEIAQQYRTKTGTKVDFSFGGSGELERQIQAGAPVDVFASAGESEMDELEKDGLIDSRSRADFAGNSLVLVIPADSKLNLTAVSDLASPQVRRIAMGNPDTVPAGHYTQQLLQQLDLWQKLKPKLIYAENVRQALDYVMRGEVDAGIVYSTDVAIANSRVRVAAQAPQGDYGPVRYPIALVKNSPHPGAARKFIEWVMGREGQSVLREYGFQPVR